MDPLQAVVLALVQGLTEILPISSSGHLILVPWLFGWPDQGLAFDVAVHVGTLVAMLAYFRADVVRYALAGWRSLFTRSLDGDARVAWALVVGTVPAAVAGLLFQHQVETTLRSPRVIATTTVVYALVLLAADLLGRKQRTVASVGLRDALLVGCAQALALVPGTSRSGITMTAGLALGLDRAAAARFAFLLAMPIIAAAGALDALHLARAPEPAPWGVFALAIAVAAASAYACIHYFLRWIQRVGMWPFVVYRLLLGVLLWIALA